MNSLRRRILSIVIVFYDKNSGLGVKDTIWIRLGGVSFSLLIITYESSFYLSDSRFFVSEEIRRVKKVDQIHSNLRAKRLSRILLYTNYSSSVSNSSF